MLSVHKKQLPVPSFFQVYNYGGGNGDKDREIVYSELTEDTPALINYFYINNDYPHSFQSCYFDDLSGYRNIAEVYNNIRERLILDKNEKYIGYSSPDYDFNEKIFLLDSGAFNIVKQIAENINYEVSKFSSELLIHMKKYYDFANMLKLDLVVGFDLGGKYTEKDNEKSNDKLNTFLSKIDMDEMNNMLLEEGVKYLSKFADYYPYVLATVHGFTQDKYARCVDYILSLEKQYNYKFWGFALGGIASYKKVDHSWYSDINFKETKKRGFIDTVTPARACRIVRNKVGTRPIHALGCGGYSNITMNYYCGATSFDAASPVRRVGDGSFESTKHVYQMNAPTKLDGKSLGFSKYFVGGINEDGSMRREECGYRRICDVPDTMKLCGCLVCKNAGSIHRIKDLYAQKWMDTEANYYSRQLMGLHAVWQHRKLCEVISTYNDINDFYEDYPNDLNKGLIKIYNQL